MLFDTSGFVPRWTCGQWTALHGWTHIIADVAIWGAYIAIPIVLALFVLRRRDLPFPPVFWLFAAFIFTCGTTHLIDAILYWWPIYRVSAVAKVATALASWATVFGIILIMPRAMKLPGLAKVNEDLSREITERRRAEGLLRESQEHLRFILDATGVGTWDWDLATGKIQWSQNMENIHGLSPGAFDNSLPSFLSVVHAEDRPPLEQTISHALRTGQDYHLEYRVACKGGLSWLAAKAHIIKDPNGKPLRVAGICIDVSARKQADTRFRLAVEASPSAVVLVDDAGLIVMANTRVREMFGYEPAELIGKRIEILVPDRYRERHVEHRAEFSRHPEARPIGANRDLFGLRRDGTEVPVEIGLSPIQTTEGLLVLATIVDITSRKLAEAERTHLLEAERAARNEAERANRLKDMFLANVSHELRTPLNAILGWSQLLSRAPLDGEAAQAVGIIQRNARVQTRLIEDLLDMSRIISGKIRLELQTVDLALVVNSAVEAVLPAAQMKNITIERHIDPQVAPVCGDANRLQQVAWNLLSNAIKFTPKGGRVEVNLCRKNSYAEITVADNGQGIKPEFLPYLFDRFRQEDPSITRSYTGLGLGLSIVKHLVDLHGGTIRGESEGKGATFVVQLPLSPFADAQASIRTATQMQLEQMPGTESAAWGQHSLQGVRVLVVDDDVDACELAHRVLEDCGATVATAESAANALAQFETFDPDVIVSDIGMPEQDGYQFIQEVRRRQERTGENTPAAALTAFTRLEDRDRALLAGYQAHISKPLAAAELIAVVASLSGRIKDTASMATTDSHDAEQSGESTNAASHATGKPERSGRILLVEDNKDVAEMIKAFLEESGYEVQVAGSIAEAVELHHRCRFDALISDLGLPDGSGLNLMPRIREHRPIPGIVLSGYEGRAFAEVAYQAGYAEYLVKPADEQALLDSLDRLLNPQPTAM